MSSNWLNYLNVVSGSASPSPPNGIAGQSAVGQGVDADLLSDELRQQLEQWTTVSFAGSDDQQPFFASHHFSGGSSDSGVAGKDKVDLSPYAKRPFGHLGSLTTQHHANTIGEQQHYGSLEKGFNAFSPSANAHRGGDAKLSPSSATLGVGGILTSSNAFNHFSFDFTKGIGTNDIGLLTGASVGTGVAVDGSNTLFASPLLDNVSLGGLIRAHDSSNSNANTSTAQTSDVIPPVTSSARGTAKSGRPSKKSRTGSISSATPHSTSTPPTPVAPSSSVAQLSSSTASASGNEAANGQSFRLPVKQPLLTKAAILAAQVAELKAQAKVKLSAEEEAARQAELNRIAAEDDKRRRNTAASARFRVKKKQREAALEIQILDLNGKVERLEKDLEAARIENGFLRDLVIRKVGLGGTSLSSSRSSFITSSTLAKDEVPSDLDRDAVKLSGGQEGTTGMGTKSIA